jgi:hypothetical protein
VAELNGNGGMFKRAGLFMLGVDIAYNIGSFSLSAPQTTERRINDTEGTPETPKEAMRWVWLSTWKMLAYNGFASFLAGSVWPILGGLVVIADLHASYRWAIYCGLRKKHGLTKHHGRGHGKKSGLGVAGASSSSYPSGNVGDDDTLASPPFVTDRYSPGVRRR